VKMKDNEQEEQPKRAVIGHSDSLLHCLGMGLLSVRMGEMMAAMPLPDTSQIAKMERERDMADALRSAERAMFGKVDKVIHEFDSQGHRREEMARMSSLTVQPLNRPTFQKNESKQRAKQRGRKR